jgi:hypothetical protein
MNKNKFEVWAILEDAALSNHYKIDREVKWITKLMETFDDLTEAKQYIKDQTKSHFSTTGEVVPFLINLNDKEKDKYLEEFCFTNDLYIPKRRFFIGKPSKTLMKNMVISAGLQLGKNAFKEI